MSEGFNDRPKYDDRTSRGWPLPHWLNKLDVDSRRLREILRAIDAAICEIESSAGDSSERLDSVETRLDVIAGQTTEDTEILDARVDAENQIHPNLGHNIRNLHNLILVLNESLKYTYSEFLGLLRQFGSLAEAQIQYELNEQEAHERRKREIQQEAFTRAEQDNSFQQQVNALSEGMLRLALTVQDLAEKRREYLKREEAERISEDSLLQTEINTLAESCLRDTLNLYEAIERHRLALKQEIEARTAKDSELQEQISENTRNIQREEDLSLERDLFLVDDISAEIRNRKQADDLETQARADGDLGLARQADANAEANMRNTFNLQDVNARRKADLIREEKARISHDENLQRQIDQASQAGITNALNLADEATERRKVREALDTEISERTGHDKQQDTEISRNTRDIEAETQERVDGDLGLAQQADANAEANIRNTLNIQEANQRRKAEIAREEKARISSDENLQAQINRTAEAEINNALNLHQEAEQRRKSDERIEALNEEAKRQNEVNDYHQQQIDAAILSILRNILTLDETLSRRREALQREEQSRFEEDSHIQAQTNTNAEASMRNALNIQEEASKRRQLLARLIEEKLDREHAIQDLRAEIGTLYEIPLPGLYESLSGLQKQSDKNAEAGMHNALNLHEEAERRRGVGNKIEVVSTYLQRQIDSIIHAILEDSVNLHDEVIRRKASENDERQSRFNEDTALQSQLNTAVQGILQNTLNLSEALSRQREALKQEADARANEDTFLQSQANTNAITGMELALALSDEAGKRRILERTADRSKYTSLAIPEPRCAVVNISGINAMPTSKTVELHAVIEFWDMQGNYFRKNITCAAQGNSSMGYVKKNVKFDLLNNDGSEFELKIGDWVAQDGFHLKAYYTDFFRGVAVASYKFWDEVMTHNAERPHVKALYTDGVKDLTLQLDTGALCHPDGFPCLVYLNGEFYGIFAWQIKKQRKNYRMDKSTVEHIHIDGTLYTQYFWNGVINWTVFEIRNPNKLYTMDGKKYDGDAPRELIDETSEKYDPDNKDHKRTAKVKKYIQALVQNFSELKTLYTAYTRNRTDENLAAVKAKYEEIFDWENQRDYLIFSDIIKNSDGFGKNWQWTTYDGVKWYVNAYDLDMSFGGHWQGTQITPPLTGHITTSTAIPTGFIVQLYREELETRYKELRDAGIISVSNIFRKLQDWVSRIGEGYYEREYERWPNSPCILNYTDSLARVKSWLETEIANMDRIYNYSPDDSAIKTALALEVLTRENSDEIERIIRTEQDAGILAQVNQLAIANMWLAVREHETHRKVKEIEIEAELIPARAATDEEFDEMLDKLYNNP